MKEHTLPDNATLRERRRQAHRSCSGKHVSHSDARAVSWLQIALSLLHNELFIDQKVEVLLKLETEW
jgi:hypothetical protein